jgi:hypothetical protein
MNTVGAENPPKQIELEVSATAMADNALPSFVASTLHRFFHMQSIPADFLNVDPYEWGNRQNYHSASAVVRALTVANDAAE